MAAALVYTLTVLYFEGVKGKAETATSTFSQRFSDIVTFNLGIVDFDGIEKAVTEFRQLNGEVSEVAVIVNNSIRHSSNRVNLNKPWVSDSGAYEFKVDLAAPAQGRQLSVAVRVPRTVVYERVQRSIKNFAALFIASIFLSGIFLQVAVSLQSARSTPPSPTAPAKDGAGGDIALILLKPLYFLGVFLDSLTYAFLPKFMQEAATASGMPESFASVPFTAYYLLFALSLIPAGNLTERYGPNRVIVAGLILAGASVLGLALPIGIFEMTGFRALAGIGQGLLLIGVQSYILNVASPDKKTQGTAIIVLGFQGGMLSGMAIGSLLVNSLHPQGVFIVAGGVGLVAALYTLDDAAAYRWKRAGHRRTACHDAAPRGRLQKRDHRRPVSQGDLLHRNSREGAADGCHQFCHSADPYTAAVPGGGHRPAHHALWAWRGRIHRRRFPPGRSQSQYPGDSVLGRHHERLGPHAGRTHGVEIRR